MGVGDVLDAWGWGLKTVFRGEGKAAGGVCVCVCVWGYLWKFLRSGAYWGRGGGGFKSESKDFVVLGSDGTGIGGLAGFQQ